MNIENISKNIKIKNSLIYNYTLFDLTKGIDNQLKNPKLGFELFQVYRISHQNYSSLLLYLGYDNYNFIFANCFRLYKSSNDPKHIKIYEDKNYNWFINLEIRRVITFEEMTKSHVAKMEGMKYEC